MANIASFTKPASNYRTKPASIKINGHQFFPLSDEPDFGDDYYYVDMFQSYLYETECWSGYKDELEMLKRGLLFATAEEAAQAGKALFNCIKFEN